MRLSVLMRAGGLAAAILLSAQLQAREADSKSSSAKRLDLNTATAKQLEELPGIGPALSKKIIDGRPYKSVDDLSKAGIASSEVRRISALVTVNASTSQSTGKDVTTESRTSKGSKAAKDAKPALINLNTATTSQLETLPGIGPASAKKIMRARPYKSVDDLKNAGLPTSTITKVKPLVTVDDSKQIYTVSKPVTTDASNSSTQSKSSDTKSTRESTRKFEPPPQKGMVWVNTDSKIYHKEGTKWYGTTRNGKYMTEEDAKKAGYTAANTRKAADKSSK